MRTCSTARICYVTVAAWMSLATWTAMVSGQVEIIPVDAQWLYLSPDGALEDPGDADASFDANWFKPDFDATGWSGPDTGPFEYGGIDAVVNSPTVTFLTEPLEGDRYTNYFRHDFTVNQSYPLLAVDLLADDGAVIYLDGEEVLRFNCCVDDAGNASDDDYLNFANGTGAEGNFRQITLDELGLSPGDHTLAVSVHQAGVTSSDLGFGLRLLSVDPPPPPNPNAVIIREGIDTTLAEAGLGGPDAPHGAEGDNPDGVERWEFDGSDGGGMNHGLLWFDIPAAVLNGFGDGSATLALHVNNNGHEGQMHRMTVDWLAEGNDVTWNSIPDGPGIEPGLNAEDDFITFPDSIGREGEVIEVDVTEDVKAWASGQPNYGWGFVPIDGATDGHGITSFENALDPVPTLTLIPGEGGGLGPPLQAGDADRDLDFDQLDLVKVQIASKYLTGQAATWGDGDWNAAPGGTQDNPPAGDGFFNQIDIIAALNNGLYLTGPYAALAGGGGVEGDGQTSVIYDAGTGTLAVDAPAGTELTSINVDSAAGIFTAAAAENLGGSFDNDADNNIFKATFGGSFGSLSFGAVAQAGLSEEFVLGDLTVVGSLAGGGDLGNVDLIYVPEPSTCLLVSWGALLAVIGASGRRR